MAKRGNDVVSECKVGSVMSRHITHHRQCYGQQLPENTALPVLQWRTNNVPLPCMFPVIKQAKVTYGISIFAASSKEFSHTDRKFRVHIEGPAGWTHVQLPSERVPDRIITRLAS